MGESEIKNLAMVIETQDGTLIKVSKGILNIHFGDDVHLQIGTETMAEWLIEKAKQMPKYTVKK